MYLNREELLKTIKEWKGLDSLAIKVLENYPTKLIEKLNEDKHNDNEERYGTSGNIILSNDNINDIKEIVDNAYSGLEHEIRDLVENINFDISSKIKALNLLPAVYDYDIDLYIDSDIEEDITDLEVSLIPLISEQAVVEVERKLICITDNIKYINMNEKELYEKLLKAHNYGMRMFDNGFSELNLFLLIHISTLDSNSFKYIEYTGQDIGTYNSLNLPYIANIDICLNILKEKYD